MFLRLHEQNLHSAVIGYLTDNTRKRVYNFFQWIRTRAVKYDETKEQRCFSSTKSVWECNVEHSHAGETFLIARPIIEVIFAKVILRLAGFRKDEHQINRS